MAKADAATVHKQVVVEAPIDRAVRRRRGAARARLALWPWGPRGHNGVGRGAHRAT